MLIEISNRTTARKTGNSRVRGSELNHGHVKKKSGELSAYKHIPQLDVSHRKSRSNTL